MKKEIHTPSQYNREYIAHAFSWGKQLIIFSLLFISCHLIGSTSLHADTWDGTIATSFASGSGTSGDPYLISSAAQLAYLAQEVNNGNLAGSHYYSITTDIDLDNRDWTPIGNTDANPFAGTINGNGHTISNVYIFNTQSGTDTPYYVGFIRYSNTVTINGLTLSGHIVNGTVSSGTYPNIFNVHVGGFIGQDIGITTLQDCVNNINIDNYGKTSVVNSTTYFSYIGGFMGECGTTATFNNCGNNGSIVQRRGYNNCVAAFVGNGTNRVIILDHCYNTGFLKSDNTSIAYALVVVAKDEGTLTNVYNSYNMGVINTGTSYTGVGNFASSLNNNRNNHQWKKYYTGTESNTGMMSYSNPKELSRGQLAYKLNRNNWDRTANSVSAQYIWAQGDSCPVIADATHPTITTRVIITHQNTALGKDTVWCHAGDFSALPTANEVHYYTNATMATEVTSANAATYLVAGPVTLYASDNTMNFVIKFRKRLSGTIVDFGYPDLIFTSHKNTDNNLPTGVKYYVDAACTSTTGITVTNGISSYNPGSNNEFILYATEGAIVDAAGENGTSTAPYLIDNAVELDEFSKLVSIFGYGTFCAKVNSDNIDVTSMWGTGLDSWIPIGTATTPYTGTFDGNGKHLINNTPYNIASFFGFLGDGALVKDLMLSGTVSNSTGDATALFDSIPSGTVNITGCRMGMNVTGNGSVSGFGKGIASGATFNLTDCYNSGTITNTSTISSSRTTAFVGYNAGTINFTSCYNIGELLPSVTATERFGNYGYVITTYTGSETYTSCYQITDYCSIHNAGITEVSSRSAYNYETAWNLNTRGGTAANARAWSVSDVTVAGTTYSGAPVLVCGHPTLIPIYRATVNVAGGLPTEYIYNDNTGTITLNSNYEYFTDAAHTTPFTATTLGDDITLYAIKQELSITIAKGTSTLTATAHYGTATTSGNTITVNSGSTTNIYDVTYQWKDRNGNNIAGATSSTLTGVDVGPGANYSVYIELSKGGTLFTSGSATYQYGRLIYVNYSGTSKYNSGAAGVDTNDGLTPQTAVKTIEHAYSLLQSSDDGATVESNVIVLMSNYTINDFIYSSDATRYGQIALIYNKPATVTGKYNNTVYTSGGTNPELNFYGTSTVYNGRYLFAGTKIENLTFIGAHTFLYCQGHDLTMGNGISYKNYTMKGAEFSSGTINMGQNMPQFNIFGGWCNYSYQAGEEPYSQGDSCVITVESGSYLRIIGGGRTASVSGTTVLGRAGNPFHVSIHIKGTTIVNLVVGGQTDGTCFMSSKIFVEGGTTGRVIGGTIGYGRYRANYPNNTFYGVASILMTNGTVKELFGGNLGRYSYASDASDHSDCYFYGMSSINIKGGTVQSTIYGAGAGGVTGYNASHPNTVDDPNSANFDVGHRLSTFLNYFNNVWGYQQKIEVNISDSALVKGNVYGGGYGFSDYLIDPGSSKRGYNLSDYNGVTTYLAKIGHPSPMRIYAPSNVGGVYCDTYVNIKGGTIKGNVYGGSRGTRLYKDLVDTLAILYPSVTVYKADNTYDYQMVAPMYGNSHVNVTGGSIEGMVFGAGEGVTSDTLLVNGLLSYKKANNYKNSNSPYATIASLTGDCYVEVAGGHLKGLPFIYKVGNNELQDKACIMGAGYCSRMVGNTYVTLNGGVLNLRDTTAYVGSVFGGGLVARLTGDTHITQNGMQSIYGFFGGGCSGDVLGSTHAILKNGSVSAVFGGGGMGNTHKTNVLIDAIDQGYVHVVGAAYGGGLNGTCDSTEIILRCGLVGYLPDTIAGVVPAYSKLTPEQLGVSTSLYGGGYNPEAQVQYSHVKIEGGYVQKSVYGGGNEADVTGGTLVEMKAGKIWGYLYGGGYNGSVCTDSGSVVVNVTADSARIDSTRPHYNDQIIALDKGYYKSAWGSQFNDVTLVKMFRGVYGGCYKGDVGTKAKPANVYVNIAGDHIDGRRDYIVSTSDSTLVLTWKDKGSIFGGAYYGDIFGDIHTHINYARVEGNIVGGNRGGLVSSVPDYANVYGNVYLDVNNTHLHNSIYGGGYDYCVIGDVAHKGTTGNVTVNVQHSAIGYFKDESDSIEANILGGAYRGTESLDSVAVRGNTTVNLYNMASIVGSVYGGGYYGNVGGNTYVHMYGGKLVSAQTTKVPGYYYGQTGRVYQNIYGGSIFGGGYYGGVSGDSCTVTTAGYNSSYGHMAGTLFGGGREGDVKRTHVEVDSIQVDGTYDYHNANQYGYFGTNAYGDCAFNTEKYGPYYLKDSSGNIYTELVAVGNPENLVPDTAHITYYVAFANNCVFGGGLDGEVNGNTYVELRDCSIGEANSRIKRNLGDVYGGGWRGQTDHTYVKINGNCDVYSNVFGGGYQAIVHKSTHIIAQQGYIHSIYGGGYIADVTDSCYVTLDAPSAGKQLYVPGIVYGGASDGHVGKSTLVKAISAMIGYIPAGAAHGDTYSATWSAPSVVTPTTVDRNGSIYGGCYGDTTVVYGNSNVTLAANDPTMLNIYNCVFGGSQEGNIGTANMWNSGKSSNTYVKLLGGTIRKNIFGGSDEGYVFGDTHVLAGKCSYYKYTGTAKKTYYSKRTDRWNNVIGTTTITPSGSTTPLRVMPDTLRAGSFITTCLYDSLTDQTGLVAETMSETPTSLIIQGGIYGGGNTEIGSTAVYAATETTMGNSTIIIHDVGTADHLSISSAQKGGVFCDGNLTLVRGMRAVEVMNYGYGPGFNHNHPKLINCFQRADLLSIINSNIKLYDARDFSPQTPDGRTYSLTRIGELQLLTTSTTDSCYVGFYNPVNYLGCVKSNVQMNEAYFNENGAAVSGSTYKSYKVGKGYTDANRNNGTGRCMIAVANGNNLVIHGEKAKVGSDTITYFGPVCGVVQLFLLNSKQGEGGGYVYADNIHEDATNGWLETSGNFVFNKEEGKYIIDDCFPTNYNVSNNANAHAHYWYVQGWNYTYNITMTCYTNLANKVFTIYDPLDLVMFPTSGSTITGGLGGDGMRIDTVRWKNHETSWIDGGAYTDSIFKSNRYKLYMTMRPRPTSNGTDSIAYEVPKLWGGLGDGATGGTTWGTVTQNNPAVNFTLFTPGNDKDIEMLKEGDTLTLVVRNTNSAFTMGGHNITYTIKLALVYLKGPQWTGQFIPSETDILPGARVLFTELPHAYNSDDLPILGFGWDLVPLNTLGELDELHSIPITESTHELPGDFTCYYYENRYYLRYYAKTSAGKFGQLVSITVHDYHRMKDVMKNPYVKNYMYLYQGCRAYIEDAEDLAAFYDYCNNYAVIDTVDVKTGRRFNPRGAEGIDFYIMNDITLPDSLKDRSVGTVTNPFLGTLHGMGSTIKGLHQSLFGYAGKSGVTNGIYNLGVAGDFTANPLIGTVTSGSTLQVENCFTYTTASTVSGHAFVGSGSATLKNCFYQAEKSYTGSQGTAKGAKYYNDGRLTYDLNSYYTRLMNAGDTAQYLKDFFFNGDYQYAKAGAWREATLDEHGIPRHNHSHPIDYGRAVNAKGLLITTTSTGKDSIVYKNVPKFPADYRFFGQFLTYDASHDATPRQILTADTVYRAPAYYLNSVRDSAYFNAAVVIGDTTMTALDLTGKGIARASQLDLPPYLTSFATRSGVSKNLLVYSNKDNNANYTVLKGALQYSLTAKKPENVLAQLITCAYGDTAIAQMWLVDKQNFNAPIAFTVSDSILYKREPHTWADGSHGWETIVLPYETACTYAVKAKSEGDSIFPIQHFYGEQHSGKDFWLREYYSSLKTPKMAVGNTSTINDSLVYYKRPQESVLLAGKPYIVAFPGETFNSLTNNHSLQGMYMLFAGSSQEIPVTDKIAGKLTTADHNNKYDFVGTFTKALLNGTVTTAGEGKEGYKLNFPGNMYTQPQADTLVMPFRAMMLNHGEEATRRSRLYIGDWMDEDGNIKIENDPAQGTGDAAQMTIKIEGRKLIINTPQATRLTIYSVSGQVIKPLDLPEGEHVEYMSPGVYIVNHKKYVVL